jgi:phosphomevalonate kinase
MKFTAPGKVVLWGEYAVLAGAPAAVMAVNRYAQVDIETDTPAWRFTSLGLLTPSVHRTRADFCHAPAAAMAETALRHWGAEQFPARFALASDTSSFYHRRGEKLGIGSSAALCVATCHAMAHLIDTTATLEDAIAVHRLFQGGTGSGLDVAASWHGGVIRFQQGVATCWTWPAQLGWQVVWTGASAATHAALGQFAQWQAEGDTTALTDLAAAAHRMFDQPTLASLEAYSHSLRAMDVAAQLNIFTPPHQRLATIAADHGLVYKPCGAGGGDIGLACGMDQDALAAFARAASDAHFVPLDLEIAPHGVKAG